MDNKSWFAVGENGQIEYFATEAEAKQYAEEALDIHREYALDCGEWHSNVGSVCYGRAPESVTHRPEKCCIIKRCGELDGYGYDENGVYWGRNTDCVEMYDYRFCETTPVLARDEHLED